MPGLLVIVQPGGTPEGLDRVCAGPLQALTRAGDVPSRAATGGGYVVAEIGGARAFSRIDDPDLRVWVYGTVYPPAGQSPADYVAACWRQGGAAWSADLNGEFNAVILDKRAARLLILNDRIGLRPWYVATTGNGFVLSPDVKGALAARGSAEIDEIAVAAFLAFNKIRLGDRTLVKGVEVLPAASLWTVDLAAGRVNTSITWRFRYNDALDGGAASDEAIAELVERFKAAMRRRTDAVDQGERIGLSLSGGLDSRAMVAALPKDRAARLCAHTYGLEDSDEVRLAVQTARIAGMPQALYHQDADVYVRHAGEGTAYNDELDIFVQGGQLHWLRRACSTTDCMLTGLDLDVTLGGIYLTPDVLEAGSDADVLALLKKRNALFSEDDLSRVMSDRFRKAVGQAPYDWAAACIRSLPQEQPAAKYDLFVQQYSMRRVIMMRYALIRHFMETASPMYDRAFIDCVRTLSLSQRAQHRSFLPFLHRLSPELEAVPYQRTMLPASAPREFWARSQALETQREQLYVDLWRETKGRVYVPYRRYYTNFGEWLRLDPGWLKMTEDLLLNRKARIYARDLIRPKAAADMVAEHRCAIRDRRQVLIALMSLELYLRWLNP
jgi:asparagine synthase (glutamine-hydrolysing)